MAGETQTPYAVVTVDGVARQVASVRITRELATDMPAQVAAGGGMVAATANVEWADDVNGVQDSRVDPPGRNARFTIDAGTNGPDGVLARRFTGKTDASSGTAADGGASTELVDDSALLNKVVTTPTHFAQEPSGVGISWVGLGTPWLTYEVARQCGLSAYHHGAGTMVWASLAGSTLPANGLVPGYSDQAAWSAAAIPNGIGLSIAPGRSIEYAHNPIGASGGQAVEASIWADVSDPGYVRLVTRGWKSATGQRGVWLYIGYGGFVVQWENNGTYTTLASQPAPGGWQPVAMHMRWTSTGYEIRVRVGSTVYGPYTSAASDAYDYTATAKWATMLQVNSGDTITKTVAGLVVDRIPTTTPRWTEHNFTPRFKYVPPAIGNEIKWSVLPPQDAVQGMSLMKDMSSAELAGLWVDEDGTLTYKTRTPLRGAPVTKTVTSDSAVMDYSWRTSLDALRKRVVVKWRRPVYTIRMDQTVPVWDSGDQSWKRDDLTWQQFAEPGSDEDWYSVDTTFVRGLGRQRVTSSWYEIQVKDDATNNVIRDATTTDLTLTAEALGGAKARTLVKVEPLPGLGATNYAAGKIVLNARGKATWTDETTYSDPAISAAVPDDAPDLVHDVGWMMQGANQAQIIADHLARLTSTPLVEVDNVSIAPDPSIRLGDKIRVEDRHAKGWAFEGIVSRVDETWASGSASMTLGLRVTYMNQQLAVTLAQFDRYWAGVTLGQFDAAHAGKTLGQLDAAPLT